jgi:two-component system cell cycle response regulator DivK
MMQTPPLSGVIILVVDDEAHNRTIAAKLLAHQGATVHLAGDGEEALTLLKTLTPTLILLDISMPKMDGFQTIAAIRTMPNFKNIPVVAFTAHAMVGDADKALAAGFNAYITKPLQKTIFIQTITDQAKPVKGSSTPPPAAKDEKPVSSAGQPTPEKPLSSAPATPPPIIPPKPQVP